MCPAQLQIVPWRMAHTKTQQQDSARLACAPQALRQWHTQRAVHHAINGKHYDAKARILLLPGMSAANAMLIQIGCAGKASHGSWLTICSAWVSPYYQLCCCSQDADSLQTPVCTWHGVQGPQALHAEKPVACKHGV